MRRPTRAVPQWLRATAPMPLASLIHDHMLSGVARGLGDLDWAALTRVLADNAGCDRG